jgi:methylmalonyl-CoA mutase N-terminal domain/subunit
MAASNCDGGRQQVSSSPRHRCPHPQRRWPQKNAAETQRKASLWPARDQQAQEQHRHTIAAVSYLLLHCVVHCNVAFSLQGPEGRQRQGQRQHQSAAVGQCSHECRTIIRRGKNRILLAGLPLRAPSLMPLGCSAALLCSASLEFFSALHSVSSAITSDRSWTTKDPRKETTRVRRA